MSNLSQGILIVLVQGWPWHWAGLMSELPPPRPKCTLALTHLVFEEVFLAFALPGFCLSLPPLEIFLSLFHPVYAFHVSVVMTGRSLSARPRRLALANLPGVGFLKGGIVSVLLRLSFSFVGKKRRPGNTIQQPKETNRW